MTPGAVRAPVGRRPSLQRRRECWPAGGGRPRGRLRDLPSWELRAGGRRQPRPDPDGSRRLAQATRGPAGTARPQLRPDHAMQAGFDQARGRMVVSMDGDLQNDPQDIPRLLAALDEGYDLVAGYRLRRQDDLLKRKVPSWIANRIIRLMTGVSIRDNGCSLKGVPARDARPDGSLLGHAPVPAGARRRHRRRPHQRDAGTPPCPALRPEQVRPTAGRSRCSPTSSPSR